MPAIQATTIGGKLIDGARWEVKSLSDMREGQNLHVSVPVGDKNLIHFLGKQTGMDCVLEREEDKSHYVVLTTKIMQFRHMLDHSTGDLESLVYVSPANRTVEEVLTYMLDKDKCNPKFIEMLKKL